MKLLTIPSISKLLLTTILAVGMLFSVTKMTSAHNPIFTFEQGWNLVSADVVMELEKNQTAFNNLLEDGAAIYGLNPVDKKYYGGSGSQADIDASLEKMFTDLSDGDDGVHAMGWWIYMPRVVSIEVAFAVEPDLVKTYQESYHFRKGWNLIGTSDVMVNKSFNDITGNCSIQSFYGFENAEGGWQKATNDDLNIKFSESSLGRAFAVKMLEDCKFGFSNSITPSSIPQIPE
jgi:hypothetical protein